MRVRTLLCLALLASAGCNSSYNLNEQPEREGDDDGECEDGNDNDGDGLFDCDDEDCAGAPACVESTSTACVDSDSDGVCDPDDVCPGADDALDADADGTPDGCDVCAGSDDGLDADGDGVPDGCDVCEGGDDAVDADGDGVAEGCDCDDADATAYPGAYEVCDGDLEDCDGVADVGCPIPAVYAIDPFASQVVLVDPATAQVTGAIAIGSDAQYLSKSPDGLWVVVSNSQDDTLTVIDATTQTVFATHQVAGCGYPMGTLVTASGRIVVACAQTNSLADIDLLTGIGSSFPNFGTDSVQRIYEFPGYSTTSGFVVASDAVYRVDLASFAVLDSLAIPGGSLREATFDVTRGHLLVADSFGLVHVLDPTTLDALSTWDFTGTPPFALHYDAGRDVVYADISAGGLVTLDPATGAVLSSVPVDNVEDLTVDAGATVLWAGDTNAGTLHKVDLATFSQVDQVSVGSSVKSVLLVE